MDNNHMPGNNEKQYTITRFPASRVLTHDIGRLGLERHHVKALLDVDVTLARGLIKNIRKETSARISFTSWVLFCIARALAEHPQAHALRKGKYGLVSFRDVDLTLVVEKELEGTPVPVPLVMRGVESRGLESLRAEIDAAKAAVIKDVNGAVIDKKAGKTPLAFFTALPQFLRLFIWKILLSDPFRVKRMMGTAIVTSVGMMGHIRGWIVPVSIHTACFALGSIIEKPIAVKGETAIREMLQMTVLLDHDVIDGAPAARFIARLVELLESGHGLFKN